MRTSETSSKGLCLMNAKRRALVTVASWEERFILSCNATLAELDCESICVFYFDTFAERTRENRELMGRAGGDAWATDFVKLDWHDPASTWLVVVDVIEDLVGRAEELVMDLSTMPREIVWYVLWAAEKRGTPVECRYGSPAYYGGDWVSRDPLPPRMAFKLSGVAEPSRATALVITVGYDLARVQRLVTWCEPNKLVVGLQEGDRFKQNEEAMEAARTKLQPHRPVYFPVDAFGDDFGEAAIAKQVKRLLDSHNVVLGSMGPRSGALALYRIQRRFQQTALVCAPAGQYNEDYSKGMGERYSSRVG